MRPIEGSDGDSPLLKNEKVTTNFWSAGIAQQIPGVDDARLNLFGRYGLRKYEKPFTQRDTGFWTIGSHVEWSLTDTVDIALGYHYELGLADGRKEPEPKDDISYSNHFMTGDSSPLRIQWTDHRYYRSVSREPSASVKISPE